MKKFRRKSDFYTITNNNGPIKNFFFLDLFIENYIEKHKRLKAKVGLIRFKKKLKTSDL